MRQTTPYQPPPPDRYYILSDKTELSLVYMGSKRRYQDWKKGGGEIRCKILPPIVTENEKLEAQRIAFMEVDEPIVVTIEKVARENIGFEDESFAWPTFSTNLGITEIEIPLRIFVFDFAWVMNIFIKEPHLESLNGPVLKIPAPEIEKQNHASLRRDVNELSAVLKTTLSINEFWLQLIECLEQNLDIKQNRVFSPKKSPNPSWPQYCVLHPTPPPLPVKFPTVPRPAEPSQSPSMRFFLTMIAVACFAAIAIITTTLFLFYRDHFPIFPNSPVLAVS